MQRLLQVCCAAVALTALAACSDSTLTSPTGAARAPGARSSVITPTTQTVCSSAATLVDHGQTLPGSGLAAVQVVAPNPNWHTPITLNAVNSIWVIPPGGAFTALNAPDFELSHYQASFSVPANNTATLDGSSFTDNQLTSILVNNTGTSLGSNATLDDSHNYDVNGTALTWSTSGLAAGSYTLDFYVKNNNHVTGTNPTGIDFCFEVVSTPIPPPPAVALFVIGNNQPHAIDDIVNFWGAQWWKNNPTSITSDNGWESFKGFAPITGTCGQTWSSGPGNSDPPPAAPLPSSINIIVTDKVNKNGNTLSGNIIQIITVTQDGHYDANPGHAGNGVVTAVVCPAG